MAHKIMLTSMLPFFPQEAQMPLGMCVATIYLLVILLSRPYFRWVNDDKHERRGE
jgi:hypothetical protein